MRVYDNFLSDEFGQPIQLNQDELVDYLLHCLHQLRSEKDLLQAKLDSIRLILNSSSLSLNDLP
jgi:aryl carrier-like protein